MAIDKPSTQELFFIRSTSPVHINPSIMEGETLYTSILGPDAAVVIVRYAPVFMTIPTITGSFKIPSVMTCNPGVINASPQAAIFYQWYGNGEPILGETNKTITTNIGFDGITLTCGVTAVNFLGVAYGMSNGIDLQIIEPIINEEYLAFAITGAGNPEYTVVFDLTSTVMEGGNRIPSLDTFSQSNMSITGLKIPNNLVIEEKTDMTILGLKTPNHDMMMTYSNFALTHKREIETLAIVNPSFDTGDISGWTSEGSSYQVLAIYTMLGLQKVYPVNDVGYFITPLFVSGTSQPYPPMVIYQNVAVSPASYAQIDANLVFVKWTYFTRNFDVYNTTTQIVLECYNEAGTLIGTPAGPPPYTGPLSISAGFYSWDFMFSEEPRIPPLTRTIKVKLIMSNTRTVSTNYVDLIVAKLLVEIPI